VGTDVESSTAEAGVMGVIRAFDERDYELGMRSITEDCQVLEVGTGEVWRGHDGLRAEFDRWWTGFPDAANEVKKVIGSGEWMAVEAIWAGTHEGPLVLPDQTIAPTGSRLAFPYVTVAQHHDGVLFRSRHYYDVGDVLRQLGVE
jgi:predicted ester cyclase